MRLFITGDVHSDIDCRKLDTFAKQMRDNLTLDDYIVICGDFGIVWDGCENDKFFADVFYKDFPCTIIWVDGNHENFDLLHKYPQEVWMGGKVHRISDRILHLMRGEIFTVGGLKIFAFGGAKSTDRGYDTGHNAYWWPEELPSDEEIENAFANLKRHGNSVDLIVTHDAPYSVLSCGFGMHRDYDARFNEFLETLVGKVSFRTWFFGHHHDDLKFSKFQMMYNDIREIYAGSLMK